ncbi:hypothetical protein ACIRS3_34875 [Streptomyces virginiae]|uniref:hypothetical protein n=1 Tax=Streptomyces virginiae TaxID=1961 RepID=UPI003810A8FD
MTDVLTQDTLTEVPSEDVIPPEPDKPADSYGVRGRRKARSAGTTPQAAAMDVVATGLDRPTGVRRYEGEMWVLGKGGTLHRVDEESGQTTLLASGLGDVEYLGLGVYQNTSRVVLYTAAHDRGILYGVDNDDGKLREAATGLGNARGANIIATSIWMAVQEDAGGILWKIQNGTKTRIADNLGKPQDVSWITKRADDLYVTDEDGGRLLHINKSTGSVKPVADGLGKIGGIYCTRDNEAFVVEKGSSGGVWRIDLATGRKEKVASGIGDLHDIHVSGVDVYVTDQANGGRILRLNRLALPEADTLTLDHGDRQRTHVGGAFQPLSVLVTRDGNPAEGRTVAFEILDTDGTGTTFAGGSPTTAIADTVGKAETKVPLTAGEKPGTLQVKASSGDASATFQLTVKPASQPIEVTIPPRTPDAASPGKAWIYPAFTLVVNKGQRMLDTEQMIITAPPGMYFKEDSVGLYRQGDTPDKDDGEHRACGERSADHRTLTIPEVPFNTRSGCWVKVYPTMAVDPDAQPGTLLVTFKVGSPAVIEGHANVTISSS